jgi:nucleoside 2-deoxyribosyltransferase
MSTQVIYCSGPLFSPEEQAAMSRIARILEQVGYGTFLPHRDGLETAVMAAMKRLGPPASTLGPVHRLVRRAIFALDVYQIVERCEALVFNMNGRVPDEGGVAEAAIAFSTGRPVVLYKEDARSAFDGFDNPMVSGLSTEPAPVGRTEDLPAAVERALHAGARRATQARPDRRYPDHLSRVVDFGRTVSDLLERWRSLRSASERPDALLEELNRLASAER